jgi:hypothetical protein
LLFETWSLAKIPVILGRLGLIWVGSRLRLLWEANKARVPGRAPEERVEEREGHLGLVVIP